MMMAVLTMMVLSKSTGSRADRQQKVSDGGLQCKAGAFHSLLRHKGREDKQMIDLLGQGRQQAKGH
jgi:hypothetical protein